MSQGQEGAPGQAGLVIRPGSCLVLTHWADWQATPLGKLWQGYQKCSHQVKLATTHAVVPLVIRNLFKDDFAAFCLHAVIYPS